MDPHGDQDDATSRITPDRPRRIRDAVEAALADILLPGTDEHVRLASQAAIDLAAGRPIHTAELVVSLRTYIHEALDLDPVPDTVSIPAQGPARPQAGASRGGRAEGGSRDGGAGAGMGSGFGMGFGIRSEGKGQEA